MAFYFLTRATREIFTFLLGPWPIFPLSEAQIPTRATREFPPSHSAIGRNSHCAKPKFILVQLAKFYLPTRPLADIPTGRSPNSHSRNARIPTFALGHRPIFPLGPRPKFPLAPSAIFPPSHLRQAQNSHSARGRNSHSRLARYSHWAKPKFPLALSAKLEISLLLPVFHCCFGSLIVCAGSSLGYSG
jgi:hypothetical protein